MYFCPYGAQALNSVQNSALLANILTLFVGIMLIIDKYLEDDATRAGNNYDLTGRNIISVIILVVNIAVVVLPILVKASNSDALKNKIARVFSNKLQKMKPELLPGMDATSNSDVVFDDSKYLQNIKSWV